MLPYDIKNDNEKLTHYLCNPFRSFKYPLHMLPKTKLQTSMDSVETCLQMLQSNVPRFFIRFSPRSPCRARNLWFSLVAWAIHCRRAAKTLDKSRITGAFYLSVWLENTIMHS
eukprot:7218973-Karenia_brevis.AAC.1